jgi:hypothetical protein
MLLIQVKRLVTAKDEFHSILKEEEARGEGEIEGCVKNPCP